MYPIVAHSSPALGIGGLGYWTFLFFAVIWMIRLTLRGIKRELKGDRCYKEVLSLFGLSSFLGLSALGVLGLLVRKKTWWLASYGYEPHMLWDVHDILWVDAFLWGIGIASFGFLLAFISYNLISITKSRIGGLIIRVRYWILGVVGIVLGVGFLYVHLAEPMINRSSLMDKFEKAFAMDAYNDVKHVIYYEVWPMRLSPPTPPSLNGEELKPKPDYDLTFGYKFLDDGVHVLPEGAKSYLDKINVYRGGNDWNSLKAEKMLRFVGKYSVMDIWISPRGRMRIYTSLNPADKESILGFETPYQEIMQEAFRTNLQYHSRDKEWFYNLKTQLNLIDSSKSQS